MEHRRVGLLAHVARDRFVADARSTAPMSAAISRISSGPIPAVVTAAVPSRRPLVTNGFSGSFGIVFLFVRDPGPVERLLRDLAGDAERTQVDEHQVVVGAAGHDAEAFGGQRVRERAARW